MYNLAQPCESGRNNAKGGTFSHEFSQHKPYYNWGYKDAAGIETPRALSFDDIFNRGPHYLIYDLDSHKTVEFASWFTMPWSLGDKHDLSIY